MVLVVVRHLGARYELLGLVGQGGMGEVYRARHTGLGKAVESAQSAAGQATATATPGAATKPRTSAPDPKPQIAITKPARPSGNQPRLPSVIVDASAAEIALLNPRAQALTQPPTRGPLTGAGTPGTSGARDADGALASEAVEARELLGAHQARGHRVQPVRVSRRRSPANAAITTVMM